MIVQDKCQPRRRDEQNVITIESYNPQERTPGLMVLLDSSHISLRTMLRDVRETA